jgi:hypothetical protein
LKKIRALKACKLTEAEGSNPDMLYLNYQSNITPDGRISLLRCLYNGDTPNAMKDVTWISNPRFLPPIQYVRIMDNVWPLDATSLLDNEDKRFQYFPIHELFKLKTVTKFTCNRATQVSTVTFDDADCYATVLTDSYRNSDYFCKYLESLGHIDAYNLSQLVRCMINKILMQSDIQLMAQCTERKIYHKKLSPLVWDYINTKYFFIFLKRNLDLI